MQYRRDNKGFSLVELMVAMAISLVLLIGLIQVFISSKRSYLLQDSIARMQENGRYALERLSEDLRLAGYLGGNADVKTIAGDNELLDGNCATANFQAWATMLAQGIFGINDGLGGYGGCITAAGNNPQKGQYLGGDVLTLRYVRPTRLLATDTLSAKDEPRGYYLKSSPMEGQLAMVGSEASAVDGFFTALSDTPITYNKVESYAYYTGFQTADCSGNDVPVPALYRLRLGGNGTPEREEIVRGGENLQVQYGVDRNRDGAVDQYLNADNVDDWAQVRAARIWLLVREECPSPGYTNDKTYAIGDISVTPNDNFRRHLYTTTALLRNRGGL